ncbi:CAP-associated domain-containing protein [Calorimonas adulescens]|uniref:CAP-associated domain-containing protein n=1 Tax=Calorimonas adulescens TaxID=2606906 RepID=UPI001396BDF8|nr:CAP-associated domain-containing protein [Calorimonas adulescens]
MRRQMVFISFLLLFFIMFPFFSTTSAKENISVTVNGRLLDMPASPVMYKDRVLVPMRSVFEALGHEVIWDGKSKTISSDGIWMQIDNPEVVVNGKETVLDVPPRIVDGYTMVPVRAVSEGLGARVIWSPESNAVSILVDTTIQANSMYSVSNSDVFMAKSDSTTVLPFDVSIGDTQDKVVMNLGEPQRKDKSEYGFKWWIYNKDYSNYIQIGIDRGRVVAIYTNSTGLRWNDISYGEGRKSVEAMHGTGLDRILKGNTYYMLKNDQYITLDAGDCYATIFFDNLNNSIVTSIQLIEKSYEENIGFFGTEDDEIARAFEMEMLDLVNSVRVRDGLKPLTWNEKAHEVALYHSKDMALNNYFDHIDIQGKSPFDRMKDAGLKDFVAAGENIAAGYRDAIFAHEGWMNSEGHRKNVLNKGFEQLGVGVYFGGQMNAYYTQNFVTLR